MKKLEMKIINKNINILVFIVILNLFTYCSSLNVNLIGGLFGGVDEIAVSNNYAYISAGGILYIFDVSDNSNPNLVIFYDTPGFIKHITIKGNYAYIADNNNHHETGGGGYFRIYNISNVFSIEEVGSCSFPGDGYGIFVSTDYAYIAAGDSGLRIFDISNLNSPQEISFWDTPGTSYDVFLSTDYAYIADGNFGLRIINISNPDTPTETGSYITPDIAKKVCVKGIYAYIAARNSGLRIIDISNPNSPNEVSYFNPITEGTAHDVTIIGEYAYLASYDALNIIDISNPLLPIREGSNILDSLDCYLYEIFIDQDYAYLGNYIGGFYIFDISDKSSPNLIKENHIPGRVRDISIKGDYIYVLEGMYKTIGLDEYISKIWIVDISNLSYPKIVSDVTVSGTDILDSDISDNYLFIANADNGMKIYDITNQTNLQEIFTYSSSRVSSLSVVNNFAYLINNMTGICTILDISNPQSPKKISEFTGCSDDFQVSGNYIYFVCGGGVKIIDISNPYYPKEIITFNIPGTDWGLYVYGNYLYFCAGMEGLRIIDISNPCSPFEVGYIDTLHSTRDCMVVGNYAYVTSYDMLYVINIEDPVFPQVEGYYDKSDNYVFLKGENIYIIDRGFLILDFILTNPQYSIIGYVKDENCKYLENITVKLSGKSSSIVKTNQNGQFIFKNLEVGNYTVTPEDNNYSFQPMKKRYSPVDINFDNQNFIARSLTLNNLKTYPNPVKVNNDNNYIKFENLPIDSQLDIYNIAGEELFSAKINNINFYWYLSNNSNKKVSSGIYFYVITFENEKKIGKIAIIK